jgi:hypothetical protein
MNEIFQIVYTIELSGDLVSKKLSLLVARYILHHQSIVDLTQSSVLKTKDNPFQIL